MPFKKYTNTFTGSTFPDDPYRQVPVTIKGELLTEYLPAIRSLGLAKGLMLLCTAMAKQEGFAKGTRSYRTNNPGNVGNTDSGANATFPTLAAGINRQADSIIKIVSGLNKNYPLGKQKIINPFFSAEVEKNSITYGFSGYLPGYSFVYTGQLDQFIKIYSTGARASNSYINTIVSYFKQNSVIITPDMTLDKIIAKM